MKISEPIFESIQGEGRFVGTPSIFIRVAGCNLRCKWCDTKYSWDISTPCDLSVLDNFKSKHLVVTGGEPMLYQNEIQDLLDKSKYEIEIETNGTIEPRLKGHVYYSVSPKLKSSFADKKYEKLYSIPVLEKYAKEDSIFKFVCVDEEDYNQMIEIVKQLKLPPERVYIMPEGVVDEKVRENALKWIPKIIENGFKLSLRMHIWIWGNKKGT